MNGPLIDSELFPLLERKTNKQTETFKPNSSNQTNKKNVSSGPAVMAHNNAVKPRPSFFEIHLPLPCAGGPWAERAEGSKQQPESSEFRLSEISFIGISPPPTLPHTYFSFSGKRLFSSLYVLFMGPLYCLILENLTRYIFVLP